MELDALLILLGTVWIHAPSLTNEARFFFRDLELTKVYENFYIPLPASNHLVLRGLVVIHVLLFTLRISTQGYGRRAIGNPSSLVFDFGSGYLFQQLRDGLISFRNRLLLLLILLGTSLIVRGALTPTSRG